MTITIEAAMKIGGLAQSHLLAGHRNIDNIIEYIDLIEAPYESSWNTAHYLYLTSFYSIKDDIAEQIRTIDLLSKNRCAGLVFQDYCLPQLAPEVIERAEHLGLPLIQVSKTISWAQIIIPLSGAIFQETNLLLQRTQQIHRRLMDVILGGGGLQEIAFALNNLIKLPLAIVNLRGSILASAMLSELNCDLSDISIHIPEWEMNKVLDIPEYEVGMYGIVSGNQRSVVGLIVIKKLSRQIDDLDLIAIEQAAIFAAMVMMSQEAVLEAEKRLRRDFIDDLLGGNYKSTEAIAYRAHSLGWNMAHKNIVFVVDLKYFEEYYLKHVERGEKYFQQIKTQLFEIVNDIVLDKMPNSIVVDQSDSIVVLPHIEDENPEQIEEDIYSLASRIQKEVRRLLKDLTIRIAIGGFYQTIQGLCQSYAEAKDALKVSKQLDLTDYVVWSKELAVYSILSQFVSEIEAQKWLTQTLGPLIAYDQDNGTDLVKTMETYFDSTQSVKQAAYRLYIHPKTLTYRLKRITEILGTDPFKGHKQFGFHLATKLTRFHQY